MYLFMPVINLKVTITMIINNVDIILILSQVPEADLKTLSLDERVGPAADIPHRYNIRIASPAV